MSILYSALRHHIQSISDVTNEQYSIVESAIGFRKLKKNQYLVQEGDAVPNEYFVLKGCLKASLTDAQGKEHIVQFAMEDWWISDYRAFYSKQNATLSVICLENCEVLSLSLIDKERLARLFPPFEQFFRKKITSGFLALQNRVLSNLHKSANERYQEFLSLYPSLEQRISNQLIASYLGITRETLSRIRAGSR
jgi:CRP/FNR family transcriptional regulator, cyclic AMP receptor protein